jgi:hypothetical protein
VIVIALAAGVLMIAVAWIPSYWWAFGFQDPGQRYEWFVVQGNLHINRFPPNYVASKIAPIVPWVGGFGVHRASLFQPLFSLPQAWRVGPAHWYCEFPLYLAFLGFATSLAGLCVYPRLPFARRRWRRKHGLCLSCGYNLTGNVSGVCSECGEKV